MSPTRAGAAAVSIALLALVLSPILRDPMDDGFPLSTYPMFAMRRPTQLTLDYAYGETAAGERRTLSASLLGTGEVLQAVMMYARAVTAGKSATQPLCARIAAAIATADDERYAGVVLVRIVTGTHDAVAYLVDGTRGSEVERERCRVMRVRR